MMRATTISLQDNFRFVLAACLIGYASWATLAASPAASAQERSTHTTKTAVPAKKLEPVFPQENQDLIFVEGEEAVVTNFDKQAILNYSASGLRTLQLSTISDPTDSDGYYADYVFYVEKPGTYELWYGGTPPGPKDTSQPSYSSPFKYSLDGKPPVDVYSNDVSVLGSYTPSYYWNRVGTVDLTGGRHQLQFRVTEKRKYDNRYFFYLDCFFLVRMENGKAVPGKPLPAVFPASLTGGKKGEPFKYIEDYLIDIRDHPTNVQSYIDVSLVYSLVGDNLNALKYLNRAAELDPKNETVNLLQAKNLLWKGDVANGLASYRDLLNKDPSRVGLWAEAGKVAAWSGRYSDSISFFTDGLKHFPDNLNLTVNLGLTYLWSGDEQKAQSLFTQARTAASKDYGRLMQLGQTLTVAQAYDRAASVYEQAISDFPQNLEGYLSLEKLYLDTGKSAEADKVHQQIVNSFVPSDRLNRFLELATIKQNLKSQLIQSYEQQLTRQPDNLGLRELLAKAYFWNGMQEKGTSEYLNILANYTYRKLREVDDNSQDILRLLDRGYVFERYFQSAPAKIQQLEQELSNSLSAYQSAANALKSYQDKVDAAKQKGQTPPAPPSQDPHALVTQTENALAAQMAKVRSFLDQFSRTNDQLKSDEAALGPIEQKEKTDQSSFEKLIASNNWHWRQDDTMTELQQVQSSGATLAAYSMAKIDEIDGQLSSAVSILENQLDKNKVLFGYELSQSLLWMGNVDQAKAQAQKLPAESAEFANARPWVELDTSLTAPLSASGFSAGAPDTKLLQNVLAQLDAAAGEATRIASRIAASQSSMRGILRDRLTRAMYQNQENTFQLRRDLGDYYLGQKKYNDAIRLFRQVLSIDPWNIGALYRLGQVYQQEGNWKQALTNYEKVYYSDPTYENVVHQYNSLARQHPDSLSFDAQSISDTQRLQFTGSADYTTLLNSVFGLDLHYGIKTQRLFQPYAGTAEEPSSYRTDTVSVGVPIDLYSIKLKVTPQVGAILANRLDRTSVADTFFNAGTSLTGPQQYFGYLTVDPLLRLDAALSLGRYIYLSGDVAHQRQPDTYAPDRLQYDVFDNSGELNISTNLGFIGGSIMKNSSVRTYGRLDYITQPSTAPNYIWTALGEVDLGILNLNKPTTHVALVGNAQFQTSHLPASDLPESYLYYTPIDEVLAGGGLQGSAWLPVGTDSIGVNLRTIASTYIQKAFSPDNYLRQLQLSGEARVEYDRGNAAVYLDASLSGTYLQQQGVAVQPALTSPYWNYWSMTISLGYSAQLPSLLAP